MSAMMSEEALAYSVRCSRPQLSIIIPAYNAGKTLQRMLGSIVAQSFDDYEAIVIDDGSSDNTTDVFRHEVGADGRFRLICLETNKGVSNARNVGLDQAKGDYIYFCDADDWLVPNALKVIAKTMATCDVAILAARLYRSSLPWHTLIPWEKAEKDMINGVGPIASGCEGFIWCYAFRRQVIGLNRFNVTYPILEDAEFISRVCVGGNRVAYISEPLYCYEAQSEGSALGTMTLDKQLLHKRMRKLLEARTRGNRRSYLLIRNYSHACFGVLRRVARNRALFNSEGKLDEDELEEMRALDDWRTWLVVCAAKHPTLMRPIFELCSFAISSGAR